MGVYDWRQNYIERLERIERMVLRISENIGSFESGPIFEQDYLNLRKQVSDSWRREKNLKGLDSDPIKGPNRVKG